MSPFDLRRLRSAQKIERPLSNLISEISIPPPLVETILDSEVGEPWLIAVPELESRLDSLKARPRVKAARAVGEVGEGLRIVVCSFVVVFLRLCYTLSLGSNQNSRVFPCVVPTHSE